jgi:hypothetical protein
VRTGFCQDHLGRAAFARWAHDARSKPRGSQPLLADVTDVRGAPTTPAPRCD